MLADVNSSLRCLLAGVLSAADVNFSLLCLLAGTQADELAAADINFSLRCLLANGHCVRLMLLLDACSARRRVWDETMPWNFRSEVGVVVIKSL